MNNITEDLDLIGAQLLDPKSGISKIGNIYIRGGKIHHKQPNQIHASKILDLKDHVILPGYLIYGFIIEFQVPQKVKI